MRTIEDMFANGFISAEERMDQFRNLAQLIRQGEHAPGGSLWVGYMQTTGSQRVVGLALFHLSLLQVCDENGKRIRFATIDDLPQAILMFGDISLLPLFAEVVPDFSRGRWRRKRKRRQRCKWNYCRKCSSFIPT